MKNVIAQHLASLKRSAVDWSREYNFLCKMLSINHMHEDVH